jgi:dUTP pyrophosphatase
MEELTVFVSVEEGVDLPSYATGASSGMDLMANLEDPLTIRPLERSLIPTGIRVAIPEGYEAEIRPRSGIAHKFGVTVLNTPGTVDSDYRGEVKVLLVNLGSDSYTVRNGDRIAQMVFRSVVKVIWHTVESLPQTIRGQGGFGSTGV